MAFTIRPAKRADSKALIGLYGQSGCGKTMSALLLARGLVGPTGKLVLIDTESGRGSLYADVIPGGYDVIELGAPFAPTAYVEAIEAAEKSGAECIIVDSMSHEWEGIGGVGDMAAQIEARTGKPGLHCWKEPKLAHQKMLLKLLQAKTHVICCLRAKRKSKQVKDERGKTAIVKDDFYSPKQDGDFIFEMQVHAEILADHRLRVTKVSHPALAAIFKDGVIISEATGRAVAEWAKGGTIKAPPPANDPPSQPSDPDNYRGGKTEADQMKARARATWSRITKAASNEAVDTIMDEPESRELVRWLLDNDKDTHKQLIDHANGRRLALKEAA